MTSKAASQARFEATSERYWPPPQGEWIYDDYTRLPDNGMRYEVIKGDLYMTPALTPRHQRAGLNLALALDQFVKSRQLGEVYNAPIDLLLPDLASPVQPDLLFIAHDRLDIVKEKFIEGAPDLIVEILSPGSRTLDRRTKFEIYARAGVREYWLVDPDPRSVEIFVLRGQAYAPLGSFGPEERTRSEVLAEFGVKVEEICPV